MGTFLVRLLVSLGLDHSQNKDLLVIGETSNISETRTRRRAASSCWTSRTSRLATQPPRSGRSSRRPRTPKRPPEKNQTPKNPPPSRKRPNLRLRPIRRRITLLVSTRLPPHHLHHQHTHPRHPRPFRYFEF